MEVQDNRKRQISRILDTAPNHATEYNLKIGFAQKNINTDNASMIGNFLKSLHRRFDCVSLERGYA